ncbi:MAG: hypothetical protein ACYC9X_13930 [Dehalococcoidia bacterium]
MAEWEDMIAKIRDLAVDAVEIKMPRDVRQEAERIIDERQLGEEGLLHVFATGVAYLRGERQISQISADALDPEKRADLDRAVKLLLEESTHFATLRFKASRMAEDNQILAMREAGWRTEALSLEQRNKVFREDEDRLKARIAELQAENALLKAQLPDPEGSEPAPLRRDGLFGGLLRRWRRDGTPRTTRKLP